MPESFLSGKVALHSGDCLAVLPTLAENRIDSVVCDPPYHLTSIVKRFGAENAAPAKSNGATGVYGRASAGFMGKQWDGGDIAFRVETWREVLRVMKPGAHLFAFSGTRTYHRMACAIEDAGFEIRDQFAWCYASGFPKSLDISKAIDKAAGAEREKIRELNPRNPKATGGGRDGTEGATRPWIEAAIERGYHEKDGPVPATAAAAAWDGWGTAAKPAWEPIVLARKPLGERTVAANVLRWGTGAINIDGCRIGDAGGPASVGSPNYKNSVYGTGMGGLGIVELEDGRWPANILSDGSREDFARYFFTAKADSDDRLGSKHPTVKPVDLIQYLVRLVTPPKGTVLDCFAGTGTTGEAAFREGFSAILIEREEEYQADIRRRMALALAGPDERARESIKARLKDRPADAGPLFGGLEKAAGGGRQIYGVFADERSGRSVSKGD